MTDQQLWSVAVSRVTAEYAALPAELKQQLSILVHNVIDLKSRHQELVTFAGAEVECGECHGACCRFGKHYFSAIDLLAYLVTGRELFTADFDSPVCPFHNGSGCLMDPGFRPFTCIIFICEQLEFLLGEQAKGELAGIELELRRINAEFDRILGNRFGNGVLITCQRALDKGMPFFKY